MKTKDEAYDLIRIHDGNSAGYFEQKADDYALVGEINLATVFYEKAANVSLGHNRAARCEFKANLLRLKNVN